MTKKKNRMKRLLAFLLTASLFTSQTGITALAESVAENEAVEQEYVAPAPAVEPAKETVEEKTVEQVVEPVAEATAEPVVETPAEPAVEPAAEETPHVEETVQEPSEETEAPAIGEQGSSDEKEEEADPTSDTTEQTEEKEEITYSAQELTFQTDRVSGTISVPAKAQFTKGASAVVEYLKPDTDKYKEAVAFWNPAEEDQKVYYELYKVSFKDAEGKTLTPAGGTLTMKMKFTTPVFQQLEEEIISCKKLNLLNKQLTDEAVNYTVEGIKELQLTGADFGVVGLRLVSKDAEEETEVETETETAAEETEAETETETETEEETEEETEAPKLYFEGIFSDSTIESVTAYADPSANLPQNAELYLKRVYTYTSEYKEAVAKSEEALGEASDDTDREYLVYDVYFLADGERIEPEDGKVTVNVSYKRPVLQNLDGDIESCEVIHIPDGEQPEIVTEHVAFDENGVTQMQFSCDSFSYIVLLAQGETKPELPGKTLKKLDTSITGIEIKHRADDSQDWSPIEANKPLAGDEHLQLKVYFSLPIAELLAADSEGVVYVLPAIMKNPVAQGTISVGGVEIADITAADGIVTIKFIKDALKEQAGDNENLDAWFFVESQINLSEIENLEDGRLVIGGVDLGVVFDGDYVARYCNVDIEKTVDPKIHELADGDYLQYTLTVTAGDEPCPEISVTDEIDPVYVVEYAGVSAAKQSITEISTMTETSTPSGAAGGSVWVTNKHLDSPGVLHWEIGDMAAGEIRTLTYLVKLKENYTGVQHKGVINNTADVFSQEFPRDSDGAPYNPKAGMNERKSNTTPVKNADGTYTITYTVWVKANDDNSYTLDNVKVCDSLNHPNNKTEDKYLNYVSYVENSFKLYSGNGINAANELTIPTNLHAGQSNPAMNADQKGFSFYVGDLAPGEERTISYQLKVEPGVFAAAGNADSIIRNRALVYLDDTRSDASRDHIQAYSANVTMNKKVWDRKLVGTPIETAQTVNMGAQGTFEVPAGSYQYDVVVNETGDWNVSSAVMKDTLRPDAQGNRYMQFVGYARVDAYTITGNAPSGTDEQVLANLNGRTPKTVWVNIDGEQSFNFTPSQIGLDGNYAIKMTYYAKPVNMSGITQVIVANEFQLSGQVGVGNFSYVLGGIGVGAEVTVSGSNRFAADKLPWYYDPAANTGNYNRGTLYWVIRMQGDSIPEGTVLKDTTPSGSNGDHKGNRLFSDSVAIYYGPESTSAFNDTKTYADILSSGEFTPLGEDKYKVTIASKEHDLRIRFPEKIDLPANQSLYAVIRTTPGYLPSAKRDAFYFRNSLSHSFDGEKTWIEDNTAQQYIYGSENILKELNYAFTWDGSSMKQIQSGKGGTVITAGLKPGTYVAWNMKINYMGNLSGKYVIEEHIPKGMEVVYARLKWVGNGYSNRGDASVDFTPQSPVQSGTLKSITAGTDGSISRTTYYYVDGQTVRWNVDNVQAGGSRDAYSMDFQVLCRVTDPDVLLGGTDKTFNNTVTLFDETGRNIGHDADPITIGKQSLSKKGTYNPNINGGMYPFELTINELGEDLIAGSDTVTLVDRMSDSLKLDISSIVVTNKKTGAALSADQYHIKLNGQELRIELPDNTPLKVTYSAAVNAAPGEPVNISNSAHWEGYTAPVHSSVQVQSFSYSIGGGASFSSNPKVTITKADEDDTNIHLSGAKFKLTEGTYQNKVFTASGTSAEGTTNDSGVLTFDKIAGQNLKFNTVYEIKEITAPTGYLKDETPHYFMIMKALPDGTYPSRIDGVSAWYQNATYKYTAFNEKKGKLTINKTVVGGPDSNTTFTFTLTKNGKTYGLDGQPAANAEITVTAGIPTVVDNLPLGTYTLQEVGADKDGFDLETVYTVGTETTNEVTLEHAVSEKTINVTNTYVTNLGSITIKKVMAGVADDAANKPESFTFTLTNHDTGKTYNASGVQEDDAEISVLLTGAGLKVENLPVGTYIIQEAAPGAPTGYHLVSTEYHVGQENTQHVTIDGTNPDGSITVTNTYAKTISTVSLTLPVHKEVEVPDHVTIADLIKKDFVFELYRVGADGSRTHIESATVHIDDNGEGTVPFAALQYSTDPDAHGVEGGAGEYEYVIVENPNAGEGGFADNTDEYRVVVTLTDDYSGTLQKEIEIYKNDSADPLLTTGEESAIGNKIEFVNTYSAQTQLIVPIYKTVTGFTNAAHVKDEEFVFELFEIANLDTEPAADATPLRKIVIVDGEGTGSAEFAPLVYSTETGNGIGTYYYEVKELPVGGGTEGYKINNTEYKLEVEITDGHDGTLNKSVTVYKQPDATGSYISQSDFTLTGDTLTQIPYVNEYEATASLKIPVKKLIQGDMDTIDENKTFIFELYKIDSFEDNPTGSPLEKKSITMAQVDTVQYYTPLSWSTKTNPTDLSDGFHMYYYAIKEHQPTDLEGFQPNTTVYKFSITLEDQGIGELKKIVALEDGTTLAVNDTTDTLVEPFEFLNIKPAAGQLYLTGTKELKGNRQEPIGDGEFTYSVYTVNNYNQGEKEATGHTVGEIIEFTPISYNNGGDYEYVIVEDLPTGAVDRIYNHVEYDPSVYHVYVNVTVTGNGENKKYEPTITKIEKDGAEAPLVFKNKYKADGEITFDAVKLLEGNRENAIDEGEFTFNIYEIVPNDQGQYPENPEPLKDASGDPITGSTAAGTKVAETTTWTSQITGLTIHYDQDDIGEHEYLIREVQPDRADIEYTLPEIRVMVKVSDAGNGNLSCVAEYQAGADHGEFINTYNASGTLNLTGTKQLTGRDLTSEDEFAFEVLSGNTRVATGTSDATGKITFSGITYDENDIGTFTYLVREVIPAAADRIAGVEYTDEVFEISVKVSDAGSGKLKVEAATGSGLTVTGSDGTYTNAQSDLVFVNNYHASGKLVLQGTKVLEGNRSVALKDKEFKFDVFKTDASGIQTGDPIATGTNDVNGNITFTAISYDQEDAGHTYTYLIKEVEEDDLTIAYSDHVYTVKVTVTDNGDGTLILAAAKKAETGDEFASMTLTKDTATGNFVLQDAAKLTFTNIYEASGSITLEGIKTVPGRDKSVGENEFTFKVYDAANQVVASGHTTGSENKIQFTTIPYDQDDIDQTYTYTIKEDKGHDTTIGYSTAVVTVKVHITDNGDGTLTAALTDDSEAIEFENQYIAIGELYLTGTKFLTGNRNKEIGEGEFTFAVYEGDTIVTEGTTEKGGKVFFDPIIYHQIGEHDYVIRELIPKDEEDSSDGSTSGTTDPDTDDDDEAPVVIESVQYSTKEIKVHVSVTDLGAGKLKAEATYPDGPIEITNAYKATGEVVLDAMKELVGRTAFDLQDAEFTFGVREESGNDVLGADGNPLRAMNAADGTITFDPIPYTQEDIGKTYVYEIYELPTDDENITIDPEVIPVHVTISDLNGTGELKVKEEYPHDKRAFINEYSANGPFQLTAAKVLAGERPTPVQKDEFSFEMKDQDTGVVYKGTTAEGGAVLFEEITFDQSQVGKHTYTVTEVKGKDDKIIYSETVYTVVLTVTDLGNGKLDIQPEYSIGTEPAASIEFVNKYKYAKVTVEKKAEDTGASLAGAVLRLVDMDGKLIDEWTTDGTAHVIKEELLRNAVYRLIEVQAPKGYAIAEDILFTVIDDGVMDPVIMSDKKTETVTGEATITKRLVSIDGKPLGVESAEFYAALFETAELTKRVSDIKVLKFSNSFQASATFKNLVPGATYYFAETDVNGTAISGPSALESGVIYTPVYKSGQTLKIGADGKGHAEFENEIDTPELPYGFYYGAMLDITKTVKKAGGAAKKTDKVFTIGIFEDAAHKIPASNVSNNVVEIDMAGASSQTSETIMISLTEGQQTTLYLVELDQNGKPVYENSSFPYTVKYSGGTSVDKKGASVVVDIDNNLASVKVTNTEKEQKETETETETEAAKTKDVATADNTNIMLYLYLMLASLLAAAGVMISRRRKDHMS